MTEKRSSWAAPGDVNAFFGLMLDNIADLLLMVALLAGAYGFPTEFALRAMIPGTAIGVLVGDLLFFLLALKLGAKSQRNNITAMPLGLDTPSTFGMVFFVLGPAFQAGLKDFQGDTQRAAMHAWHIGICAIVTSGLFKIACSFGSGFIRKLIPRAGLLGSLAAIAAVVISFLPLLEIFHEPVVGLVSLAIILTTLVANVRLPFRIPGALGALLVGGAIHWISRAFQAHDEAALAAMQADWQMARTGLFPVEWLRVWSFEWLGVWRESLQYLPVVIPFALATVVGGIDCTESAAAAGDDYDTNQVIGVEAFATLVAGLCGGVLQTTPYIGHPAYKAMGGRAAYVLATALFVGSAGVFGYFTFLYLLIPKPTVFPILVFIGLEITAQSFQATPKRHYAAVALAMVPALAALVSITVGKFSNPPPALSGEYLTVAMLYHGFIITSLIWSSALAYAIDRKLERAAIFFFTAAIFTLFGIIHSPLPGGPMFQPFDLPPFERSIVFNWAGGYAAVSLMLFAWGRWLRSNGEANQTDSEELRETAHS